MEYTLKDLIKLIKNDYNLIDDKYKKQYLKHLKEESIKTFCRIRDINNNFNNK